MFIEVRCFNKGICSDFDKKTKTNKQTGIHIKMNDASFII